MNTKKILGVAVIILASASFTLAVGQNIKLNPIKPTGKAEVLTDEQQAILAVRTAKASVVNILGITPQDAHASTTDLSVSLPPQSVAGTGFVLEADGLIVTNYHVIEPQGVNYSVIFADGTSYPAKVMGTDPFDDIALIKIDATNLVAAKLGDSDALETGQSVFAIGNSLGRYQSTVTRGVVSGLSRAIDENQGTGITNHNWIQTDASINLGNSGGPLINMAGEVVGMNTLIDSGGESLGFAIPVNTIKDVINQLKTFGTVSKPLLGIQFTTITDQLALQQNLPVKNGALVLSVSSGSAADTAGMQSGDIIIAVNGQKLNQQHELDAVVQKLQAGQQIVVQVLRNGETLDIPVILGKLR